MKDLVEILNRVEPQMRKYMGRVCADHPDPSHDISHVDRVVTLARRLAFAEKAQMAVVIPAAYLHDCVYVAKTDARRAQASTLSADKAVELLKDWDYPEELLPKIHHAISAHSFSAQLPAESHEARVVQDADRLDAMGMIGVFRCIAHCGLTQRPFYSTNDPFCRARKADDSKFGVDHFYSKLLGLADKLHTDWARREGERRLKVMREALRSLELEICLEDGVSPDERIGRA